MSFIFRFDEDLGRGFSEQSLSLPTSQSGTKVIHLWISVVFSPRLLPFGCSKKT